MKMLVGRAKMRNFMVAAIISVYIISVYFFSIWTNVDCWCLELM